MTQQAPGWFSQNWKWLAAVGCLLPTMCCGVFSVAALVLDEGGTPPAARVDCGTPGPGGVDCDVKRTAGERAFEACWNLEITCTNKSKMVASACGSLAAGVTSGKVNIPVADFSNQEACDAPASGEVQQLVIN
jgi:hypothetical protein